MQNMFFFRLPKLSFAMAYRNCFQFPLFNESFGRLFFSNIQFQPEHPEKTLSLTNMKICICATIKSIRERPLFQSNYRRNFWHLLFLICAHNKNRLHFISKKSQEKKNRINTNVSSCGYPGNKMCFLFIFCLFYLLKLNRIACACVWAYAPCDAVTQKQ